MPIANTADGSHSIMTAFSLFFIHLEAKEGSCYAHIVMKTKDQRGKRKNGTPKNLKYCKDKPLVLAEATKDIKSLHKCGNRLMFYKLGDMVAESWAKELNRPKMATVFAGQYLQDGAFSKFRYNEYML